MDKNLLCTCTGCLIEFMTIVSDSFKKVFLTVKKTRLNVLSVLTRNLFAKLVAKRG
jgi:hypothetical protein